MYVSSSALERSGARGPGVGWLVGCWADRQWGGISIERTINACLLGWSGDANLTILPTDHTCSAVRDQTSTSGMWRW